MIKIATTVKEAPNRLKELNTSPEAEVFIIVKEKRVVPQKGKYSDRIERLYKQAKENSENDNRPDEALEKEFFKAFDEINGITP